jgi:carbamoyl-phosphate synthase large subunit
VDKIFSITAIDPWFLGQLKEIIDVEVELKTKGWAQAKIAFEKDRSSFCRVKALGFSDFYLAKIFSCDENELRSLRHKLKIHPEYRAVDTCAAEFSALTPYLYSTYQNAASPVNLPKEISPVVKGKQESVMILGGGPNRIGQGIEFDYCCVHGAMALREEGYRVVMLNCNPETVSTDFDISDRLYFEPVTAETVIEIARVEQLKGVIVQFGGQTPLKISHAIESAGVTILGTSVDAID